MANHYKYKGSRSDTTGIADLKLAETILESDNSNKFEEAYHICKNYPAGDLTFNSDKFYYWDLFARLCMRIYKTEEAKVYAQAALAISTIKEPQFFRHKTVGLVNATERQLQILKKIVDE